MSSRTEQHPADLAGAYALHALDADDTATFEAHLAESERARIEAAELNDTAVALGLAVAPVQPSAAVKANLMSLLASTPQLPPLPRVAGPDPADAAASAVATTAAPTTPGVLGTPPATAKGLSADAPSAVADIRSRNGAANSRHRSAPATERAQARWFQRPAQIMLAAAAAVALFVGGTFLGQTLNTNQFASQQASGLAQINAANDSQRAATTTADGQEATLVWSNKLGISAVLVDNLPVLPSDQDYQLWYINGEGAASAGTFDSSGDSTAWRVLDGTMHAGDQVGLTVEPSGGSDQPTTDPILAFQS
ncbi:anti-sigma factor [Cryobacterium suzukii]|uniref:Regulator of SigK n=1 Tax=Cryobacterium suzukii TaxID=1259198 RepID=A0A4R9AE89_9MICO|nr:anti-sigma factor [Cryobacterium suzukii]TFD59120.1 anti-sigma factor [Cryobacterium suzukii]